MYMFFASADARLFLDRTGRHGNCAQVGRGELWGDSAPAETAADIKRIGGPFWEESGSERSERKAEAREVKGREKEEGEENEKESES